MKRGRGGIARVSKCRCVLLHAVVFIRSSDELAGWCVPQCRALTPVFALADANDANMFLELEGSRRTHESA